MNSVIDDIQGQYRLLKIENKALFFAQLENIHDQTVRYIRHYIELEFVGRYIERGFDEIKEDGQPVLAKFGLNEVYLFRRFADGNH